MRFLLTVCFSLFFTFSFSQSGIGIFEQSSDIGNPKFSGSSSYNESTQTYTLRGGGYNIWFNKDEFHFLFKKMKGDFVLTANFKLTGNEDGDPHRKSGWMIRQDTSFDAVSANACIHGDGLTVLQWRSLKGAYMRDPEDEIFFPKRNYSIIQLERKGANLIMRVAHEGEPLQEMETAVIPAFKDEVLVGLYVLAHDNENIQDVKVWNVRIAKPVPNDFHPNPQVKLPSSQNTELGSRLEIMDIQTGQRKVVYESNSSRFNSPYFISEGSKIAFEEKGDVYVIPTSGGTRTKMGTDGVAVEMPMRTPKKSDLFLSDNSTGTHQIWRQSEDAKVQVTFDADHDWFPHVSPDGQWITYISLPPDTNPNELSSYKMATLKLMPVAGGAPRVMAYLYGGKGSIDNYCWSPDSKQIVFVSNNQPVK